MESNVEEYARSSDLQYEDSSDIIEEFSDEIATMHGRCIDIGCGPGKVTNNLILPKLPLDATIVGESLHHLNHFNMSQKS